MSLVRLLRCPVEGCHHNTHPHQSEKIFLKRHLFQKHDEIELHDVAIRLGLINPSETRWKIWLIDALVEFSSVEGN